MKSPAFDEKETAVLIALLKRVTLFSPEDVRLFSGRFLGFLLGLTGRRTATERASGIGYSPCVGTSGIPTAEERIETGIRSARQRRPGGLRVLSPRPPLRDFTKEMGLAVLAGHDG